MAEIKSTGDPYVLNVQKWVNKTYSGRTGYSVITEDGYTGWGTIFALLHGLQITLGVGSTADNFGSGTESAFKSYISKNGAIKEKDTEELSKTRKEINGIIQSALLCKGYSIGATGPTEQFYFGTGSAIKKLKSDAGIDNSTTEVTLNLMKALLSMDYFYSYDTSSKTKKIQKMQRYLNANYEKYIGLKPCDGIYSRSTNEALVYALQAEEGMSTSVANGNFGPSTKRCCPTIPYSQSETDYNGNVYSTSKIGKFAKLLNMGLYVNGIGDGSFSTTVSTADVKQFQAKYALPITGVVNLTTWLSLFISCGDVNRAAKACDCATILTAAKAKTLYDNGYRYVGRYLSGEIDSGVSKALSKNELKIAFNAGLRIFPIQQSSANRVSYFTSARGVSDANSAYEYATNLGIPSGTVIYFAVDCDPQDTDITNYIIPYFASVSNTMKNSKNGKYKVGIYGTRNTCQRVSSKGYAVRSFVCDMSTGFSGNLGFNIPDNWAFDQFTTITVGSGDGQIEIDKDGFSGLDYGFNSIDETQVEPVAPNPDPDYTKLIGFDCTSPQPNVMINTSSKPINVYQSKSEDAQKYDPAKTEIITASDYSIVSPSDLNKWGVTGSVVGTIKPGDMFVRFNCYDLSEIDSTEIRADLLCGNDAVHKVLFRTEDGVVRYGYVQEYFLYDDYKHNDSVRPGIENFFGYNFNPDENKLEANGKTIKEAVFTVKRELRYISTSGTEIGYLEVGTKLKGMDTAGKNNHEYLYFSKMMKPGNESWEYLDTQNSDGGFVCLDMAKGVNGYNRALW
mgnify:FL=1